MKLEMPKICCIPPEMVGAVLRHHAELMSRGLSVAAERTPADHLTALEREDAYLWLIIAGTTPLAIFMTSLTDEGRRVLEVYGLSGSQPTRWCRVMRSRMVEYALAERCAAIRFVGPPGWGRLFPEFETVGTVNAEAVYEMRFAS